MTPKEIMEAALKEAAKGIGKVDPNPAVGAVVVRNGQVVGRGHHASFGGPHAELVALARAGSKARGAELYVTLEPCVNFDGKKTPPCAELVCRAGIRRVVVASLDPNPRVRGRGIRRLRRGGVRVKVGLLRDQSVALNRPFFKRHRVGLPYVTCKWAMSLDGKIATASGDSRWITSPAARAVARALRRSHGAVLIGSGTVLADNPRVSDRTRIILDSMGRTPSGSRILRTARKTRTIVCVSTSCPRDEIQRLRSKGAEVHAFEVMDLQDILRKVADLGISSVLIEGGGEVHASAFEGKLVDEVAVFVAPVIVGGRDAKTPVEGRGVEVMAHALPLESVRIQVIREREVLIRGRTPWAWS